MREGSKMKNTSGGFTNENALFRNQFASITYFITQMKVQFLINKIRFSGLNVNIIYILQQISENIFHNK